MEYYTRSNYQQKKDDTGKLLTVHKKIANKFSNIFYNIGKIQPKKLKESHISNLVNYQHQIHTCCNLLVADTNEVKTFIHDLKNKKSPGIDGIKAY